MINILVYIAKIRFIVQFNYNMMGGMYLLLPTRLDNVVIELKKPL